MVFLQFEEGVERYAKMQPVVSTEFKHTYTPPPHTHTHKHKCPQSSSPMLITLLPQRGWHWNWFHHNWTLHESAELSWPRAPAEWGRDQLPCWDQRLLQEWVYPLHPGGATAPWSAEDTVQSKSWGICGEQNQYCSVATYHIAISMGESPTLLTYMHPRIHSS